MVDRAVAARRFAVAAFLVAAGIGLVTALVEATMEGDSDWGDGLPLLLFSAASLVAARLAAGEVTGAPRPLVGVLCLIPAILLISEHKGSHAGSSWLLVVAAVVIVTVGGVVAGGHPRRASSDASTPSDLLR